MNKKGQNLTICLASKTKDEFGVWAVSVKINDAEYTYPINSTYAVNLIERRIRQKRYRAALRLLQEFKIRGFNPYTKENRNGSN